MADKLSKEERTQRMRRVKCKNTKPELVVRQLLYSLGYRFRLHRQDLPGTPDIVFPGKRKVIFVNGCFWHWHEDPSCPYSRIPATNTPFWENKLSANRIRDRNKIKELRIAGWDCLTIWQCELRGVCKKKLISDLKCFLRSNSK